MRRNTSEPRYCDRDPDCAVKVILAILAPTPNGTQPRWGAFEALDREPFSQAAAGSRVLVGGQAWRPGDLVEDYQVRHELDEDAAREIVSGFPFHRGHHHEPSTNEKETTHP